MARSKVSDLKLRQHFANEVHYLVHAAIRFPNVRGKDQVIFQDSALMHARNILEFTQPRASKHGWWICDFGGTRPSASSDFKKWSALINFKVTHMGEGRLKQPPWPVPYDDQRLIALGNFMLARVTKALPQSGGDSFVAVLRTVAQLGLDYLKQPTPSRIASLARLVDP